MAFVMPSPTEFKAYYVRDFQYAPSDDAENLEFVTDADIVRAIDTANAQFNASLFGDAALTAFYPMAAHFLCENIGVSSAGLSSQGRLVATGTSVGGVSQTYTIPDRVAKSAFLMQFLTTGYGRQYAFMLAPRMVGNVFVVQGASTAA